MRPLWPFWHRNPLLSLLVPFRDDEGTRTRTWQWLQRFWIYQLDRHQHHFDIEIIVCADDGAEPFSKAVAVNAAAQKARGAVYAVLDADAYMDPRVIQACAWNLLNDIKDDLRTWYVPYTDLYRLTAAATEEILDHDPHAEFHQADPPDPDDTENHGREKYGHQYAAMALMMPAEAFWAVGGMDPRFRGWGGEDAAFMQSLDTLWGLHQLTPNSVFHLHHDRADDRARIRRWNGQTHSNINVRLAQRYGRATFDPPMMRVLVEERPEGLTAESGLWYKLSKHAE